MMFRCAGCKTMQEIVYFKPAGMVPGTTIKAYDGLCRQCVDSPKPGSKDKDGRD